MTAVYEKRLRGGASLWVELELGSWLFGVRREPPGWSGGHADWYLHLGPVAISWLR